MSVLVVNLARVLDESSDGRKASELLTQRWEDAKKQHAALVKTAESASGEALDTARQALVSYEKTSIETIENERRTVREGVLKKVRPMVAELAQARKAEVVLEASATLYVADTSDITDEILKRLG